MKKLFLLLAMLLTLPLCASASAESPIDFDEMTNGRREDHEDVDPAQRANWTDMIYTDTDVINGDLPMLLPTTGETELDQGWSEDRTIYVSTRGNLYFWVKGLSADTVYRAAMFVPRADGSTGASYAYALADEDGRGGFGFGLFTRYPGVYENVTLVISGGGEVLAHTFNVQSQNANNSNFEKGLYFEDSIYSLYNQPSYCYLSEDISMISIKDLNKPAAGTIQLYAPYDGAVLSGHDGIEHLQTRVALDDIYDISKGWWFNARYTLTEIATGRTVIQGETEDFDIGSTYTFTPLFFDVNMPQAMAAGEYQLTIEIIAANTRSQKTAEASVHLGVDTATFTIVREDSPLPLYEPYIAK